MPHTSPNLNPDIRPSTGRGLWGWSPPTPPADTDGKRHIDRLLRGPAAPYFTAVIVLCLVAPQLTARGELLTDAVAALLGSTWCGANFWRCRHAHCLITSIGWLGLALFTIAEAGLGHSIIHGNEQLAFLGILGFGLAFEGAWYLARGTNALVGLCW